MNAPWSTSDIWLRHFPGCFLWSSSEFHTSFHWSYSIDLSVQYWDFWLADSVKIKSRFCYNKVIVGPRQKTEGLERKIREKESMQIVNAGANAGQEGDPF